MELQQGNNTLEDIGIGQWPTHTLTAREALDELSQTHHICPIEAFGFHGESIPPGQYTRHLKGALVQIYFTLGHAMVNKLNTYSAEIVTIRVLAPPPNFGDSNSSMYTPMERRKGPFHIQYLD